MIMRWSSCVCGLTVLAYPSWQLSNVVLAILGWAFGTTPCTAWWEATVKALSCGAGSRTERLATSRAALVCAALACPLWLDFGVIPCFLRPRASTLVTRWIGTGLTPFVCFCRGVHGLATVWTRFCHTVQACPHWPNLCVVVRVSRPSSLTTWTRWKSNFHPLSTSGYTAKGPSDGQVAGSFHSGRGAQTRPSS